MKKTLRFLAALLLILALTCSSVSACEISQEQKNRLLYKMVDSANAKVAWMVRVAKATPYDDVAWLLASAWAVNQPVLIYARQIGATVECEYEEHFIDGRIVYVDPLHVINVIH